MQLPGASFGIGRATAAWFARQGWTTGLIARGEPGLTATRQDVEAAGSAACIAPADVTDLQALEAAAQRVENELGPIDVWVNGAGVGFVAPFMDITEEEFRRVTDVTYMGVVNGTRVALRRMVPRRRGTIVNIASLVAHRAAPLQSPYSGAKYAVRGFTELVRSELLHDRTGVHLAMVHPASINTPFFSHAGARMDGVPRPPPPVYQPELVAEAVHLAIAERRREVMVGGITVQTALLNRLAPGLADRLFAWFGYISQRTRDPEIAALRDPTLFHPSDFAPPAHGPWSAFDRSAQMWMTRHRSMLALAGAGGLLVGWLSRCTSR